MTREQITLEYDKILAQLAEHAVSEPAKTLCLELQPLGDFDDAVQALDETDEAMVYLARYGAPSFSDVRDVTAATRRAESGAVLTIPELIAVGDVLRVAGHLTECSDLGPYLQAKASLVMPNPYLEQKISQAFPSPEEVSDRASQTLYDIRRKQMQTRNKIRSILDSFLHTHQKYLQDAIVTIRNDRFVLPVKAEHRNEVGGLVHDMSGSGATLFIEPMSVVSANNDLAVLLADEKREIERILQSFSAEVASFADNIRADFHIVRDFDFCFAKARYAEQLAAAKPELNREGRVRLTKARHPLIPRDRIVPIDVELGYQYKALIITGPNTGGKTVSLKTVGLLCLMAKAGLFIPAAERAQVAFFDEIFADIGDEQSIEQSLSTFSSHMSNTIRILHSMTERSLILLDELGSGTDPAEGAALAVSIIETILECGARLVSTTHYAELKLYALQTPDVENASCEFDVSTLRPTYRLLTGIPGRSNAFAIASKLGLDETIIQQAQYHLDHDTVKVESVLADLEISRKTLEYDAKRAAELKAEAEEKLRRTEQENEELKRSVQKELQKAKRQAAEIVDRARRDATRLTDELDALRREKDREDFRDRVYAAKTQAKQALEQMEETYAEEKPQKKPLSRPLREGDTVRIVSIDKTAVVLEVPKGKNTVQVQAGIIKTKVALDDLELIEEKAVYKEPTVQISSFKIERGSRNVQNELDIRGMNTLDADGVIEDFLQNCSLAGLQTVSIIHGKGTGVLRTYVHTLLRKHKLVDSFRLGVYGEGETGVTIVTLK